MPNTVTKQEFFVLVDKYIAGQATIEETDLLSRYYNSFQENKDWNENELGLKREMEAKIFNHVQEAIKTKDRSNVIEPTVLESNVIQLDQKSKVFTLKRIAVAASVIGLLFLGTFLWFNKHQRNDTAKTEIKKKEYKNDVLPGGDKAVLTLADGSTIILDNAKNGTLTQQAGTRVLKTNDGQLAYNTTNEKPSEIVYNTLSTPRGGKYQLVLPDGSKVWLNAASSIHYPTAFVGGQRKVEITGEAYFEVEKNKDMPFIVSANGMDVKVLGTHFNVNAYNDEPIARTTLLEGSVLIKKDAATALLKPGEQGQLNKEGSIKVEKDVDIEQVMAWKNGLFHFEDADIETIMRQLSRWYDVEVVYQKKNINDQFVIEMPRNSKLSDVLRVLELTGNIHFDIQGKKIIVMK